MPNGMENQSGGTIAAGQGTLEKRAEQWVIVQMHFSFAKDD